MQPEPQAGNSVEPQKRPWYRLHLSTWLMLVPVAALLVIVMVPCALIGRRGHSDVPKCVHGWPWAYAEQDQFRQLLFGSVLRMTDADPNAELPPLWLKENAWRLSEASWLNGWNLVFDLLVACAVLCAFGTLAEWRRRKRTRFFQFTLREALGAMFVTAVLCSAWKTARQQYLAERDALRQLSRIAGARAGATEIIAPTPLVRLFGERTTNDWRRVCRIDIERPIGKTLSANDLAPLGTFSRLRKVMLSECRISSLWQLKNLQELVLMEVSIGPRALKSLSSSEKLEDVTLYEVNLSNDDLFDLARVRSLKRLQWINGMGVTITDDSLDALGQMQSLEVLEVSDAKMTPEGKTRLKKMLPHCGVIAIGDDYLRGRPED